jgi:uncharacterized protein (DUF1800 family)
LNALTKFRNILGKVVKHPAMLTYLDNAQSTAPEGVSTTLTYTFDKMINENKNS